MEWPEEVSSAAHSDVNLPSSPGGLFNNIVRKHEPPDRMELDPELLRTLDLPSRTTSTDSLDSGSDSAMMDNWQMNEVFQDISTMLNQGTEELTAEHDHDEVEQIVEEIFSKDVSDAFIAPTLTESNTQLDLSDIIKETLGDEAMSLLDDEVFEQRFNCPPLDDSLTATTLTDSAAIDFDLLNELEAMGSVEESPKPEVPEVVALSPSSSSSGETSSVSEDFACVVANDHQYTQLSNVTVKPHETKKQAIRRVKNNAASRVCRKQRKNRLTTNAGKVAELTTKNNELMERIREVENLVTLLKDHLVKATSKK